MKRHRWSAIVVAAVLVPVAFFLAIFALLSQISGLPFSASEPTHQGRALLMLVVAAGLILVSFAVLAAGATAVPDDERAAGLRPTGRVVEAVVAAVVGGFLASALFVQLWDNYVHPVLFAVGVGAAFALPRRTPALLVARVTAVFAVLTLTGWAAQRADWGVALVLAIILTLPAVGAADLLVSWWPQPRVVALIAAVAFLLVGLVLWVQHDEARRHERVAAYRLSHPPLPPASIGHERILWRTPLGGEVSAGPVVSGGLVVFVGTDGQVRALDATDGSQVWSAPAYVSGGAALVVAAGVVLVPGSQLMALDLRTGKLLWQRPRLNASAGTPVVAGRVVAAAVDGPAPLVGFDLHEGTQLWQLPGSRARTFGRRFGLSALADGLVIAWMDAPNPEDGALLLAVDPSTGAVVWSLAFQSPPANVVALGGRIFGCSGSVHFGVDARTGRRLDSSGGLCDYAPVAGPSTMGIVSHGPEGIAAVDLADLHELWRVSAPVAGTPNAVADHGFVYVPSKDWSGRTNGGVRALAADTGKQLWRIDIDGGVSDRPALAGKVLIVAGDLTCRTDPCGGAIYAIRR